MNVLQFFLLSIPDHTLIPVLLLVLKMDDVPAVLIRSDDGVWIQTEIKKKRVGIKPGTLSVQKKRCYYTWLCTGDRLSGEKGIKK